MAFEKVKSPPEAVPELNLMASTSDQAMPSTVEICAARSSGEKPATSATSSAATKPFTASAGVALFKAVVTLSGVIRLNKAANGVLNLPFWSTTWCFPLLTLRADMCDIAMAICDAISRAGVWAANIQRSRRPARIAPSIGR